MTAAASNDAGNGTVALTPYRNSVPPLGDTLFREMSE